MKQMKHIETSKPSMKISTTTIPYWSEQ